MIRIKLNELAKYADVGGNTFFNKKIVQKVNPLAYY